VTPVPPRLAILAALAGVPAAAACVNISPSESTTIWETTLIPATAAPALAGQAAALSNRSGTVLGIGLRGATAGARHSWSLRLGGCAIPGQRIGADGDYPVLVASDSGTATAETQVGAQLMRSGAYHVAVRADSADTTRIACGDLVRR
jgi:hypothetical protein